MEAQKRSLDAYAGGTERSHEHGLRPRDFSEYVGQKAIVDNVKLMVESANIRNDAMDHALLYGPPGLGKTSLAVIIASALGSRLHTISGPAVERKGDLASLLTNLGRGDVLFIDEIHRLNIAVEEILYPAMEDFRLDIVIGQGTGAKTMSIDLPPFTLVGATTRSGLLSLPLRDRFLAHLHFDFYDEAQLAAIVRMNAAKMDISLEEGGAQSVARCARGTPRIANRILRRVRDVLAVSGRNRACTKLIQKALALMEIDPSGLDRMDRKILTVIKDFYAGGPVGIEALCATLGEDRLTIEDVYEPYLLKEGLLLRTPRGREISEKARLHLGSRPSNGREADTEGIQP